MEFFNESVYWYGKYRIFNYLNILLYEVLGHALAITLDNKFQNIFCICDKHVINLSV